MSGGRRSEGLMTLRRRSCTGCVGGSGCQPCGSLPTEALHLSSRLLVLAL